MASFVHFAGDDLNPEVLLDVDGTLIHCDEHDGKPVIVFEKKGEVAAVRRFNSRETRDARFKKVLMELATITL